jgi:hypothetical protein
LTAVTVANSTHASVSTTNAATQVITAGSAAITVGTGQTTTVAVRTLTFTPDVAGTYIFTSAVAGTVTVAGAITVTVASTGPTITTTGGTSNAPGQAATVKAVGDGARFVTVKVQAFAGDTAYLVSTSGVGSLYGTAPIIANIAGAASVPVLNSTGTIAGGFAVPKGATIAATAFLTTDTFSFLATSSAAGDQKITITPVGASSVTGTLTITWGATAVLSPGASILRQTGVIGTVTDDNTAVTPTANWSTTIDGTAVAVSKTAGTNASTIQVLLLNSDGTAAVHADKVSATVSGSGLISIDETVAASAGTARAASKTLSAGRNVAFVHVTADGSAGTGTVTISVTDGITGVTTVLGTKTQTYVGTVSAIAIASTNFNIGAAGKTTGAATATRDSGKELGNALIGDASVDTMPAFVIKTTDGTNAANIASSGVPSVSSADTTVVASGTCVQDTTGSTARALIGQGGSVGFYNCNFVGGANAVSGKSVVLTFKTANPAVAGASLTTTATVTIGSSTVASEKITTDATTYVAGQQMVVTITAKDASGNPVADGTASPSVTANKALGTTSTALAAGFYAGGVAANAASVAKSSLFAPSLAGAFTLTATGKDAAKTVLTASASVTDANAGLMTQIDALNAKIVALNALIAKIMKKLGVK